ncbi:hypothetical protein DYBT9275_01657 [Dyadobacter sp. CECT 9275]|uniref:Condensation domain-containing protein n=1 Tax=Dyadobacter helix TaxID=2822344 RepID=A0A916JAQ9_9BACT|nr:condensation domain-containing protein [Dyadobacter sp. CECT 9275]CAG4995518.1 hypothetical protein DYBT9275_01657 [Dyadobacter sp. CECT 9275]
MKGQQNRTLGAFEKAFWLLDQIDSKDFALAADISGTQPVEKWSKAVDMAQQRHPNLSVSVVPDELSRPTLQHVNNLHIPLRVVHAEPDYRWEQEVEKELSVRFNTEEGPLLRVVLVQKTDSIVLILSANHTVADGTSLSYLTRDILLAVTGNELELMEAQVFNDETLWLPEDLPTEMVKQVPKLKMKTDIVNPLVSSHRFSESTTHILLNVRDKKTQAYTAPFVRPF